MPTYQVLHEPAGCPVRSALFCDAGVVHTVFRFKLVRFRRNEIANLRQWGSAR